MTCSNIHKLLKNFQEDLLSEQEYEAFVSHLDTCVKCREFVGSIGFLSNQIWELGNIDVPSDLGATILFALDHPQPKTSPSKAVIPQSVLRKCVLGGVILALLVASFFFGRGYKQKEKISQKPATSSGKIIVNRYIPGEVPGQAKPAAKTPEEKTPVELYAYVSVPASEDKAGVSVAKAQHWHLVLPSVSTAAGEDITPLAERELQQKADELEALKIEIKQIEASQAQFRQHYSAQNEEAATKFAQEIADSLALKLNRKKQLESEIKYIREQRDRARYINREQSAQQRYKKDECRSQLLNTLGAYHLSPEYNANDLIIFTSSGTKVEQVLRQGLLIDPAVCSLQDFSQKEFLAPDEAYRVSVYLSQTEPNIRHWHMEHAGQTERAALYELVKEIQGRVQYTSQKNFVFSLSPTQLDGFNTRIQARKLFYKEYSDATCEEKILISNSVTISVYFTD